ncbi:MAG TPA: imidazoleglycerol-phosphate dehydratase HisB [Campylobacterales bacterium]|nr:imidazoleglycerol-phosphate dehydratase HisB [Campylobacterales bacterium]
MATINRETKETNIEVTLNPYGKGKYDVNTDIGFFNHMLESFTKHSRFDIDVKCDGDIDVDFHHCVEDVGIVLGTAFKQEVYPVENIERFGEGSVVMDEACVTTTLDISNRPFLQFQSPIVGKVGEFDCELVEEFFRAFCFNAGITAHIIYKRGTNKHHIIEATFKSFALAIRRALKKDETLGVLSTKGVL